MQFYSRGSLRLRYCCRPFAKPRIGTSAEKVLSRNAPGDQRGITTANHNRDVLGPCEWIFYYRPVFGRGLSLHGNVRGSLIGGDQVQRALNTDVFPWLDYVQKRIENSGMFRRQLDRAVADTSVDPRHYSQNKKVRPSPPLLLWIGVRTSLIQRYPPQLEIEARMLCAKTKDPRYPWVYHDLAYQAHALYVLGRIEAEASKNPQLAAHMLRIAAGLGSLDAALLLHQLEKINQENYGLKTEQQAIIAKAAEQKLDWRAMVAHCEYLVSKAKGRSGTGRLQSAELQECLDILAAAMPMSSPDTSPKVERDPPPPGCLDANEVEIFDPPYKLLLDITATEISAGNTTDMITDLFDAAALTGAYQYKDPSAARHFIRYNTQALDPYTSDWIYCANLTACDADPDACFQLGKYCLERDGWYPTITDRVTDQIQRQLNEDAERSWADPTFKIKYWTNREKHDTILNQSDRRRLNMQEGFDWIKTAAQLSLDNAERMCHRYIIVAGILRHNGFLEEGQQALLEAQDALNDSVDAPKEVNRLKRLLSEYTENWDRPVHELLTPEDMIKRLGPPEAGARSIMQTS